MPTGTRIDDITTHLDRLHRERDFSGTVLITRRGGTVMEAHRGAADRGSGVPIGSRTRFGLASVTKMFTATALLSLLPDPLRDLDTPVVDLLPARLRPVELHPGVAVRHLLTHTSGVADYFEEETATEDWVAEFAALWSERPVYRVTRPTDFLPLFADLPPHGPPGSRYRYSNAGYILLGLVLEQLTGTDYRQAVAERVFAPAGMRETGFPAADEILPDLATGHLRPRAPGQPWRSNVFAVPAVGGPDGGAFATAADLDRFLTAYAEGRVLAPDLVAGALRPAARVDGETAMGHGVYLLGEGTTRSFGAVGADPGVEAIIRRYPGPGVNTVILANVNDCAREIDALVREAVTGGAV
ncbi:serine hydrolase [Streptomyces sp. ST2-7A]|uniref:serine hydrolase domain-containing protein n=1 Tax=Streptomyces sp. ST2-7A TaxID=2907214 RepID=UPI001F25961A|nr:serine hydrolase domain-containing protein [Streptomyces sp. ST2-7A]MCE7079633.1 beta-lactamase family protein [Streptomyces sp. ST2-7A]